MTAITAVAALAVATPVLLRSPDRTGLTPQAATTAPAETPGTGPTPSATGASPAPAPARPEDFVAVTDDRALAIVSSRTGAVTRVVTTFETMPWSVDLAPDGRTAVVTVPAPGEDSCPQVVEVDVVSGARRRLAYGGSAQYSPDGRSVAYDTCPGEGVSILRPGAAATAYGLDAEGQGGEYTGSPAWSPDGRSLYVQLVGDDSNWLVRLDPAKHRSLGEAEHVVVTYVTTMLRPVPWRDTLLHMSSADQVPESREVRAARGYRDGYVTDADVLFTLPDAVVAVAVGPNDEVLASAGDSMWLWNGSGKPVEIGTRYPVFGW